MPLLVKNGKMCVTFAKSLNFLRLSRVARMVERIRPFTFVLRAFAGADVTKSHNLGELMPETDFLTVLGSLTSAFSEASPCE